jgi:kynurenine formamidase
MLYNGKPAREVVSSTGSSFAPISRLAHGVVARGVLLDAARARGVDWVEPPAALDAGDLEAVAASLGVEVRRGDAVLLRSGQMRRRRDLGPWDPDQAGVGLAVTAMEWLAQRQVAILGGDGDSDARPSPVEGVGGPVHVLAINAMGMCLLDNLDLEGLSEACAEVGSFEFLLVVAPLIVPGGTGSPVNPIAVL